jgi:cupin 2 domain-containing protein
MPNIFDDLPARAAPGTSPEEEMSDLLKCPGVRIERIVSTGQASPPGFWYDQAHDEWVLLLKGAAGLEIEGEGERRLVPGVYVFLPAGRRHRVTFTAADEVTVWLAVHVRVCPSNG